MEYTCFKHDSELSRAVSKLQATAATPTGQPRLENGLTGTDMRLSKASCTSDRLKPCNATG